MPNSKKYIFLGIVRSYSTEGNDDEKERVNVDWYAVDTGHTHTKRADNVKIIIYSKIVKLILRLTIFILNILFVRKKYPHNGGPISKSTSNSATIAMFIKHDIAIYTRTTQLSVNT